MFWFQKCIPLRSVFLTRWISIKFPPHQNRISERRLVRGLDAEVEGFSRDGVIDFELEVIEGDPSIRINGSIDSEAENVFYRLERGSYGEFSKERLFLS